MKFEDIAKYIESKIPRVRRGRSLFVNQMPAEAEFAVLLKESYAGVEIDPYMPGLRRGKFQVVVRGKDFSETKNLIEEISRVLKLQETAFTEIDVKVCIPLHEPIPFAVSDGALHEFSVNFFAVYVIVGE